MPGQKCSPPWCLLQDGHIALHLAERRCQMEVIQTLISQGCSVDFQDRHGNTPLHVACKDGNVPIVVALCEANCNLDLSNKVKLEGRSLHSPSMSLCLPASGFGQVSLFTVQSQYCFYGPVLFHRALHFKCILHMTF